MARIKQGLEYFPLNTDIIHNRIVRRVMKREGDSAFTILLHTLSYIYSGEGYYVRADEDFCNELADQLYTTDNDVVHETLRLFVEYGFFDATLYERHGILTSADIQRQFLFITKRRNRRLIEKDYNLVPEECTDEAKEPKTTKSAEANTENVYAETPIMYTETPILYTETPDSATKSAPYKKKRKEKEKKENILPNPPSTEGGDEEGGDFYLERDADKNIPTPTLAHNPVSPKTPSPDRKKREWTQEDINGMRPPADGLKRNFPGLLENLLLYRIPPAEQYAIVMKSNYGLIGGIVWRGFKTLRGSAGKIRLPGHYLLSLLNK